MYEQYRAEEKGGLRQRRADVDGDEGFEPGSGGGASANLFCNVKAAIFSSPDPVQLLFSLWVRSEPDLSQSFGRRGVGTPESTAVSRISVSGDGSAGEGVDMAGGFKQISEEFLVGMTNKGFPEDPSLFDVLNTVFVDTPRALVRDHLFLVSNNEEENVLGLCCLHLNRTFRASSRGSFLSSLFIHTPFRTIFCSCSPMF